MTRYFDVADLESVAGIVARGILPRMKLASESLATEGPPAPPRRDEDVEAEDRANARRLLAAAPEMLVALKAAWQTLLNHAEAVPDDEVFQSPMVYSKGGHGDRIDVFTVVEAAIAKAEGRTP